jgi:Flp pilus assembly protein CpaB
VVAIAVVLALLAAAGVIVYTNNLETQIETENTTVVIVSTQDIPANTQLDPLIASGVFGPVNVPNEALVATAVTSVDQLAGEVAAAPILANEQIPLERLSAGGGGNLLGISEGNLGVGLAIDGPQAVNGAITQGSYVAVFATFPKGAVITDDAIEKLFTPQQIQKFYESVIGGGSTTGLAQAPVLILPTDFTVQLLRSAKVLSVQNPVVDQTTGRRGDGQTTLALDLTPEDTSQLIFASSQAELYLALLPPEGEEGYDNGAVIGVPVDKVVGVA